MIMIAMLLPILPAFTVMGEEANYTVEQWKRVDIILQSTGEYANPYLDVEINAVFTHENGTVITIPGFWNGEQEWRVRFSPTKLGKWTYVITSNQTGDTGLDNITGIVQAVPNTGNTDIDQNGFVRLETGKKYFVYDDGTPFYWLGDTHWQMFDYERLDENNSDEEGDSQFEILVQNRLEKGFTVYQTYPDSAQTDGGGQKRRYNWWTRKYKLINPTAFTENFDVMMDYLADNGLTIALGLGVHASTANAFNEAQLLAYTRYMVARYASYPVVWITAQEITIDPETAYPKWKATAAEIDCLDGYRHPQGAHMTPLNNSDSVVQDINAQPWHEWWTLQAGHGGIASLKTQEYYKGFWESSPSKPMVETEASYEDLNGVIPYSTTRAAAWKANQCGSCGFTYGAVGIWAMRWSENPAEGGWVDSYNPETWYMGMDKIGSYEMLYLKNFYEYVDFTSLTPRFGDSAYCSFSSKETSVLSTDGNDTYVAYFYSKSVKTGTLRGLDSTKTYSARWYDPRTGNYIQISNAIITENGEYTIPDKPDSQDWTLLVTDKNFGAYALEAMPVKSISLPAEQQPTGAKLTPVSFKASSSAEDHGAELAFDGDAATCWQAFAGHSSQTITVDLGENKWLGFSRLTFEKEDTSAIRNYRIDASKDGIHWNILVDHFVSATRASIPEGGTNAIVNESLAGSYRYVRVAFFSYGEASTVQDIELFEGTAVDEPGMADDGPTATPGVAVSQGLPLPILIAILAALAMLSFGGVFLLAKKRRARESK